MFVQLYLYNFSNNSKKILLPIFCIKNYGDCKFTERYFSLFSDTVVGPKDSIDEHFHFGERH